MKSLKDRLKKEKDKKRPTFFTKEPWTCTQLKQQKNLVIVWKRKGMLTKKKTKNNCILT